jgi:mono/diheme cytochrome c family protein
VKNWNKTAVLSLALLATGTMCFAQSGGEATYKAKCQMCHGATGAGDTPAGKSMKVKSFKDPEVAKMSDAASIGITKNGAGKMPAYKDKLSDAQIKEVITYIRGLEKK